MIKSEMKELEEESNKYKSKNKNEHKTYSQ